MKVITMVSGHKRRWVGWFAIRIASILIRDCYLQYNIFLNVGDRKSVVVSPVVTVLTLRKNGEIKFVSVLIKLPGSLVP